MSKHTPTTKAAAARVYSAVSKQNGGEVPRGSWASRLDRAAQNPAPPLAKK